MAENTQPVGILVPYNRSGAAPTAPIVPPVRIGKVDVGTQPSNEVIPMPLRGQLGQPTPPPPAATAPKGTLVPLVPPTVNAVSSDVQTMDANAGMPLAKAGWYDNPVMAARAALDGLVYGLSDEAGAAVAASIYSLTQKPAEGQPKQTYSEVYNDMMEHLENERKVYTANHPYASLGLNIAGGVLSPLNKGISVVAGKFTNSLATGSDKLATLTGLYGTRTQRALARMEALAPTTPGIATTLQRDIPKIGAVTNLVQRSLRAAPEAAIAGGLYAMGTREAEKQPMSMEQAGRIAGAGLEGAAFTAAFAPLVALFPVVGNVLSNRRVAQSVVVGGETVPLTMAAGLENPALSWVYKSLVGRAFWGASTIDNQASRWYTPMFTRVEEFNKKLAQSKSITYALAARLAQSAKEETSKLTQVIEQVSKGRVKSIRQDYDAKIAALKKDAATAEVVSTAIPSVFRSQAVQAALPSSFPASVSTTVLSLMEQGKYLEANEAIRQAWNTYGFSMLNNGTFKIGEVVSQTSRTRGAISGEVTTTTTQGVNLDNVIKQLEAALDPEDLAALNKEGRELASVRREVTDYLSSIVDDKGNIKGSALATLRTKIAGMIGYQSGIGSSGSIGVDPAMRNVWLGLKNTLDDIIKGQLSPTDLAAFLEHKATYRFRLATDSAISSAYKDRGAFAPTDWLTTVSKLFKKDVGINKAPFQQEAYNAMEAADNAGAALVAAGQQAEALTAQKTLQLLQQRENEIAAEIARKMQELGAARATGQKLATNNMFAAGRSGAVKLESEIKMLEQQAAGLNTSKANLASLLNRREQMTPAEQWLPSIMLATITGAATFTGGILPGLAVPVVGATLARTASSQWFQKGVAGQQGWQQWMQSSIMKNTGIDSVGASAVLGGKETDQRSVQIAIKNANPARKRMIYSQMVKAGTWEGFKKSAPESARLLEEAIK